MAKPEAFHALPDEISEGTLLHLLFNPLILCHVVPFLSISDTLRLGATCRAFRWLIHQTPQVFRRLDLTEVKAAQFDIDGIDHGGETWRNVQLDENLTEDDFYSGPLRGIFSNLSRRSILSNVQILILDGLSVTADLCHDLIADPSGSFNVRILSIRDAKNLNENKLRGTLRYACRDSRPPGTPRLKGLYIFGRRDWAPSTLDGARAALRASSTGTSGPHANTTAQQISTAWNNRSHTALQHALESFSVPSPSNWYATCPTGGPVFPWAISPDWAATLHDCAGTIAFDAVLCTSPRHFNSPAFGASPGLSVAALDAAMSGSPAGGYTYPAVPQFMVAMYALGGCAGCGGAPEGWVVWGDDPGPGFRGDVEERGGSWEIGRFPLLAPVPLHSSRVKAAMCPPGRAVNARVASRTKSWTAGLGSSAAGAGEEASMGAGGDDAVGAARFIPRCGDCLRERYCSGCRRWWCEACFAGPWAPDGFGSGGGADLARVVKSCWECGMNCHDCIKHTQRMCRRCCGGYCILHHEGSTLTLCDWCSSRGRTSREFY